MAQLSDEEIFKVLTDKIEDIKQAQLAINGIKAKIADLQKELDTKQLAYDELEADLQKYMIENATK
jgi:hypothetical protein